MDWQVSAASLLGSGHEAQARNPLGNSVSYNSGLVMGPAESHSCFKTKRAPFPGMSKQEKRQALNQMRGRILISSRTGACGQHSTPSQCKRLTPSGCPKMRSLFEH